MRYALNTVPVNGYLTQYLSGQADMVVGATGYTQAQVPLVVEAALVSMNASGTLRKAKALSGTAPITVVAMDDFIKKATLLQMRPANIALGAKHGIPNPWMPRTVFTEAAAMNQVIVEAQDNEIVVETTDRTIVVEPVDRTIMVEKEVD